MPEMIRWKITTPLGTITGAPFDREDYGDLTLQQLAQDFAKSKGHMEIGLESGKHVVIGSKLLKRSWAILEPVQ